MRKDHSLKVKFVSVFQGNFPDAEIVKSLLADADIEAFLKNENMSSIAPWHISAGGFHPAEVLISSTDYEKAMDVVNQFMK